MLKKIEVKGMRNGMTVDTSTSVDIQKVVKIGRKKIESYKGVTYRGNFKVSPFRKVLIKVICFETKI